jgi:3-keto-L-gulonate-6-phosphate decarboxylase
MATLLQLILDGLDRGVALEMARQLVDLVDALELGPRLLRTEGPTFVTGLRDTVPDRPVACWAETEAEAQALLEIGVEGLTVPAFLSDEVLSAIIARGREAGRRILLDLTTVSDATAERERFRRLKPDLLKVPVASNLREMPGRLRELEIPFGFSGEWRVDQVPWLLLYRPLALMAGTVVTTALEPRRMVEAIRARMAISPTMSRFY